MLLMTFDNGVKEKVALETHIRNYATSKFCLSPAGDGFGIRVGKGMQTNCLPLTAQPGVMQPLEDALPYDEFGMRVEFDDVPALSTALRRVSPEHLRRMRLAADRYRRAFLWSRAPSPTVANGGAPPAEVAAADGPAASVAKTSTTTLNGLAYDYTVLALCHRALELHCGVTPWLVQNL